MKTAAHHAFEQFYIDAGSRAPAFADGQYEKEIWRDQFTWFLRGRIFGAMQHQAMTDDSKAQEPQGLTDGLRQLRYRINSQHGVHVEFKDALLSLVDAIERHAALSAPQPVQAPPVAWRKWERPVRNTDYKCWVYYETPIEGSTPLFEKYWTDSMIAEVNRLADEIAFPAAPGAAEQPAPAVHIDRERMYKALAGPRFPLPSGLSAEETARFIDDCAAGKIPPSKPAPAPQADEPPKRCQSDRDGDCRHKACPQLRDGEPQKSGRHCPLWTDPSDSYQ